MSIREHLEHLQTIKDAEARQAFCINWPKAFTQKLSELTWVPTRC